MDRAMAFRVSARDANQRFSEFLGRAAEGESIVITRRGQPVAQLVKYSAGMELDGGTAAWDRLTSILETGLSLGGDSFHRDALYER